MSTGKCSWTSQHKGEESEVGVQRGPLCPLGGWGDLVGGQPMSLAAKKKKKQVHGERGEGI